MRESASALRLLVPLLLGLFLVPAMAFADGGPAVTVQASLEYLEGEPGSQLYRFDYTVTNVSEPNGLLGLIVFFNSDGQDRAELVEYAWPNWQAGNIARNLGMFLHLPGVASLIPLLASAVVLLAMLWALSRSKPAAITRSA